MKKVTLWGIVLLISISTMLSFSAIGCKSEKTEVEASGQEESYSIMGIEEIEKWADYTKEEPKTRGVNGETPIWYSEILDITEEEIEQVRKMNLKVAWMAQNMHAAEEARIRGAEQAIKELNMELISVTDCEMDPAKQQANIETVMAMDPDGITSLAIDPIQAKEAFKPAVDAGVILSFMSGVPEGYTMGKEYSGMVTWDCYGAGERDAEILAEALRAEGKEGKIGWVYHGMTYWNTNEWDKGFKETIEAMDDMEIVAEGGFQTDQDVEGIVSAMITQHPEINGIYSSWATNAEYALSAVRAADRSDIKIVCNEITEPLALDMINDGNFLGAGMCGDYLLGYTRIYIIAQGALGKHQDTFAILPVWGVTKDTLEEIWWESYREPLPDVLKEELE